MIFAIPLFALCLASSSILSISSIANAMSGHNNIMTDMTPYFSSYPFIIGIFCISFYFFLQKLEDMPETRKIVLYTFIAFAYILSMITLHLSTLIINITYS